MTGRHVESPATRSPSAPHFRLELPALVFVRPVAASYAACLRTDPSLPIDLDAARAQHDAYVAIFRQLGIPLVTVETRDDCPDACFIEDTAVILGKSAVVTRPGAPSRRPEVFGVQKALAAAGFVVRAMPGVSANGDGERSPEGAQDGPTLDGGDVLRAGHRLFVGLSDRTNLAGAAFLATAAADEGLEVVMLPVESGLHLKSACTLVDERTMLVDPNVLTGDGLNRIRQSGFELVAAPESVGANVLALGPHLLVSASAPATAALLRHRGCTVVDVSAQEFHKGDGALTCLSLRAPQAGAFAT